MFRYEMLILASPEITKDEESTLEKQIDKLIDKAKGSIVEFDRWGKYRLAYPVRNNEYGVYFLMRFNIEDKSVLKDINKMFYVKFNAIVMRNMSTRLDPDQPLEYKRPPSLEDTPKKPIAFLDDKEMKPRSRAASAPKKEEAVVVEKVEVVELEVEKVEPKKEPVVEKKDEETKAQGVESSVNKEADTAADDSEKQEV